LILSRVLSLFLRLNATLSSNLLYIYGNNVHLTLTSLLNKMFYMPDDDPRSRSQTRSHVQSAQRKLTQQRFYTEIDPFWPTRTSPSQVPVMLPFEGSNLYSFVPNISKPEACMIRIDRAVHIQSLGIAKLRKLQVNSVEY
jgi:hypothetical protein